MLDWMVEKILTIVNFVPALLVEQGSPSFDLVRECSDFCSCCSCCAPLRFWPKRSD
jgi:hypothetical protein